eukprot:5408454-Prymnesium_polylepis.1
MAVTVPLYSTSALLGTLFAGALYFDESAQMGAPRAYFGGVAVTVTGLVVLAREKGRLEQSAKELERDAARRLAR